MITLWGRKTSFNVQKVSWALGELALTWDHIEVGGHFGGLDTPEFGALNPHRLVPVLRDGDVILWESQSIVRYLFARYGQDRQLADDPAHRARQDMWMDWAQTSLQPAFMNFFWGWYRTPEDRRNAAFNARALKETEAALTFLDRHLAHREFLAGPNLTMADIPAATTLYRYYEMEIERPDLPRLRAWYEVLCRRPAYRAGVMIPFGELKGRLDF